MLSPLHYYFSVKSMEESQISAPLLAKAQALFMVSTVETFLLSLLAIIMRSTYLLVLILSMRPVPMEHVLETV